LGAALVQGLESLQTLCKRSEQNHRNNQGANFA